MPALVKRTLVFTLLLTLVAIAFGSSRSTRPLNSPYVSALNSYTVGTAVAAKPHNCSNTGCLTLQGINSCRGGEYPGTMIAKSLGRAGRTGLNEHRNPGKQQSEKVSDVVAGFRKQG